MKKICYVTTVPGTLRSFVLESAKYIHEHMGWDISFICNYDKEFADSLPDYIHFYPVSMERGVSIGGIKATGKILRILKKEKFDLVQYSTPNAALYTSIASKLAGTPVRLYCQWGMVYVGFQGWKRKIFKLEEKLVCALSTHVEPDSFGNLRFCHEEKVYPETKGLVVWNGSASGVSLEKFDISFKEMWRQEIRSKYGINQNAIIYIFVGRVTRDKGINELLAASKELLLNTENSYVFFVGGIEHEELLKPELMAWSKEQDRIIFCGHSREVAKYLSASDIYVLPSYREGFGSAVVEAEVMGLPVIVTDIPGPTDAMQKDVTGLVVKKGDSESLYEAMLKLYENEELRMKMGAAASEWAASHFEQKQLFQYICEDRQKLLKITQ